MNSLPAIVIDLETTGLDPSTDEVLEIALIDITGEEYLNTLVKPQVKTEWPRAQAEVHHISPQDVETAPSLQSLKEDIRELVQDRYVVIYNAAFDREFLSDCLGGARAVLCAMESFASEYAAIEEEPNRWHKLVHAAHYVDHDWGQDAAHRAIHDASATASVWRWLHKQNAMAYPLTSNLAADTNKEATTA